MTLSRRRLFIGTASLVAAPAIVRAVMPISAPKLILPVYGRSPAMDALPDMERFNELLSQIGAGNHPLFLRMLHRISAEIG